MKPFLKEPVKQALQLLVEKKYAELELLSNGTRLSAQEIEQAIFDYGKTLVFPPEEGFKLIDVVEVKNANPKRWSVTVPLWTKEEGRSDLTLEVTITEQLNGSFIALNDLHVL